MTVRVMTVRVHLVQNVMTKKKKKKKNVMTKPSVSEVQRVPAQTSVRPGY